MGFLEIINRKKRNIALTIFIVACILCVTTGTGNTMSRGACKKLRTEIRTLRTQLAAARQANVDLQVRFGQAVGDVRSRILKQLDELATEYLRQTRNLEAKEDTWDRECRGKLFLDEP